MIIEKKEAESILEKALLSSGIGDLDEEKRKLILLFLQEVIDFTPKLHLVGRRAVERNLVAQLLDSFLLARTLEENSVLSRKRASLRVADIGSGAGFPGIILKILHPEVTMVLFERKQKQAFFLEWVSMLLAMPELSVREEDAACGRRSSFGIATAKAAGKLAEILPIGEYLLESGGILATIKGDSWKDEMQALSLARLQYIGARELELGRGYVLLFRKK